VLAAQEDRGAAVFRRIVFDGFLVALEGRRWGER
jgi:hypothetical protein